MIRPASRRLQVGHLQWRPLGLYAFCAALCITAVGCGGGYSGPDREAISGMVTREGLPIDSGSIKFTSKAGGPAAESGITDGRYQFDAENGPVVGEFDVTIIQHARREEVPEGTPKKDADFIPEDRFTGEQPKDGWKTTAEIQSNHTEPLDFEVTDSATSH